MEDILEDEIEENGDEMLLDDFDGKLNQKLLSAEKKL